MPKSWKLEVNTAGDPPDAWTANALRFKSKARATQYGLGLAMRWTAVRDIRETETDDPVDEGSYADRLTAE